MADIEYTLEQARDARQRIKTALTDQTDAVAISTEDILIVADHAGKLEYKLSQARQEIKNLEARIADLAAI